MSKSTPHKLPVDRSQARPRGAFASQRRVVTRTVPLLGLAVLLLMALWAPRSEARLDPYYLLRGLSTGSVKPRILFVLDTSGSMTWRLTSPAADCDPEGGGRCEIPTHANRSRINAAREGIRTVIDNVGNVANFGLMTFGQTPPPDRNSRIPGNCGTYCEATQTVRQCRGRSCNLFGCSCSGSWVTCPGGNCAAVAGCHSSCERNANVCVSTAPIRFSYENQMWDGAYSAGRSTGYYRMCGSTKRPFAYLRWDNLGVSPSVTSNNQTGAVPASPMINATTASDTNRRRKIQWFPEYMGTRIQLNATTDPGKDILVRTFGDYGTPTNGGDTNPANDTVSAAQNTNVWGHDFYYWPYVDGFIGYNHWDDYNYNYLGISETGYSTATLWSPFFLDSATSLPAAQQGPTSLDEARQMTYWLTSDQKDGGVDAGAGTPWTTVIGTIPGTVTNDNSAHSHSTVASYLKFATSTLAQNACLPTAAILVTDGEPDCGSSCNTLYDNIRALRNTLGVDVYVVGFLLSGTTLQRMACAGAGAGSSGDSNPCNDTPADNWDTCNVIESDGNQDQCAYIANNAQQLADALTQIVTSVVDADLDAGPGASANETGVGAGGLAGQGDVKQTTVTARTEYPEWRGHVERKFCEDTSNVACQPGPFDLVQYDFQEGGTTSCPQSREWDAATCLQERTWNSRKIYFNDAANAVLPIVNGANNATPAFLAAMNDPANGIPGAGSFSSTDATNFARFIKGQGWAGNYKLAGLANSAPQVIRRIPRVQNDFSPSVGIRDPHCAGRLLGFNEEVDPALVTLAKDAWSTSAPNTVSSPAPHLAYQEAVVIGSDLGLIHFFQFDSGNEMFALLPRFQLASAYAQYLNGGASMGQPAELANHLYGMAATANQGWVYDSSASKWRHVMVMGSGIGGEHFIAMDVSHLSPYASGGPLEVLWTTADSRPGDPDWVYMQQQLGESWARPALTFHNADQVNSQVEGRIVFATGYPVGSGGPVEGRYLAVLDAVTGDVLDNFSVPAPTRPVYESTYGEVSDVAVASYCTSRYWGEAQEAYVNDPAGRLFRVDLKDGLTHARDWGAAPSGPYRELDDVAFFPACQGTTAPCSIAGSNKGDVFVFSPAVAALGRIDETPADEPEEDQLLLAMASGSVYDDSTDGGDTSNDFNSSIYIIRDDHSGTNKRGGIVVPTNAPRTAPGTDPGFARVVLTDLDRTRVFTPYPGASQITDGPKKFNKGTRPVGSPLIRVTRGLEDDGSGGFQEIPDIEFYFIEFTVYEPPTKSCDPDFRDTANGVWYADLGSTYKIVFRLPVDPNAGFDFVNGAGTAFGGGAFSGAGLEMASVEQVTDGNCADGVCGAARGTPSVAPCDPNANAVAADARSTRGMGYSEIRGFTPFEQTP